MAKAKTKGQGVVLGLSEVEAYAVVSAIKTTLEIETGVDTMTTGFRRICQKAVPQKFDQRNGPLTSRPDKQTGADQLKPF